MCSKCLKLRMKYFFTADILFLGGCLRFGQIYFPLADVFHLGCHLRLELSCIQVNTVFQIYARTLLYLFSGTPKHETVTGKRARMYMREASISSTYTGNELC